MELDKDLLARQEARTLAKQGAEAQRVLARMGQEKLDTIVRAVAEAFEKEAEDLAELAVRETGFGNAADKKTKNLFACRDVWNAVKEMKAVGILRETPGLWEVGVPVGLICAIVPSTNPNIGVQGVQTR